MSEIQQLEYCANIFRRKRFRHVHHLIRKLSYLRLLIHSGCMLRARFVLPSPQPRRLPLGDSQVDVWNRWDGFGYNKNGMYTCAGATAVSSCLRLGQATQCFCLALWSIWQIKRSQWHKLLLWLGRESGNSTGTTPASRFLQVHGRLGTRDQKVHCGCYV